MRGWALGILIALLFCATAHASEAYIAGPEASARLVDAQGKALIEGMDTGHIFEVKPELYAVGEPGRYALYNAQGERACDESFEMIWDAGDALIVRVNGLCGAMNDAGAWLIEPQWRELVSNHSGGYLALEADVPDEGFDEVLFLAPGEIPRHTGIGISGGLRPFAGEYMAYRAPDGLYGYIDQRGEAAIPPKWRYAGDFLNGLAPVSDGEGYGAMDASGDLIIPIKYKRLVRSAALLAGITQEGRLDVYSTKERTLVMSMEAVEGVELMAEGVSIVTEDAALLYDSAGRCLYKSSKGALFSEGLSGQYIVCDGAWGEACQWLMNGDGSAASGRLQRLLPLCGGRYAYMTMSGVQYWSADLDAVQTSWDYESIRYGLMDASGRALTAPIYREIRPSGDDRLTMTDDENVCFSDLNGNILASWPLE